MTHASTSRSAARRLWHALIDQRTGIVCSWLAASLLALGSLWMDRRADRYAGLRLDDLRFFFAPWRWEHAWLYALLLVVATWGASTSACLWTSLRERLARRVTRPSAYGAPLVHLTFVLALVAHGLGGLTARGAEYLVGSTGTQVGANTLRAVSVSESLHPSGMPRQVTAIVERTRGATVERLELGYNRPALGGWGTTELLLLRHHQRPSGALLIHRGQRVELGYGVEAQVDGERLLLHGIHDRGGARGLRVPVADVQIGPQRVLLPLLDGDLAGVDDAAAAGVRRGGVGHPGGAMLPMGSGPSAGGQTRLISVVRSPVLLLSERYNPSVPLVMVMAVLLALGVVLVAWERLGRRSPTRRARS